MLEFFYKLAYSNYLKHFSNRQKLDLFTLPEDWLSIISDINIFVQIEDIQKGLEC